MISRRLLRQRHGREFRGEDPVPVESETELTVAALAERFMRVHVEVYGKPSRCVNIGAVIADSVPPVATPASVFRSRGAKTVDS